MVHQSTHTFGACSHLIRRIKSAPGQKIAGVCDLDDQHGTDGQCQKERYPMDALRPNTKPSSAVFYGLAKTGTGDMVLNPFVPVKK
jgi:hypothetical protein